MTTQELISKIRKIEIKTKGLSQQLFSGDYHSAFKGRGMSFSEVREYSYGDDVRNIDWNVTARSGTPHIKVFEEERELTVMLLIDVSGSQNYGLGDILKRDIIAEIAAVIAFSAMNNNDKVGAIFFSDQIEAYLPPKKGRKNILRIIREVLNIDANSKQTNINTALEYLNNVQKKKAITFILSDFESPSFEKGLQIANKKHDLIGLNIFDKSERKWEMKGIVRMYDPETNQIKIVDTNSASFQNAISQKHKNRSENLDVLSKKFKVDIIDIETKSDYIKQLMMFFKKRK